MKYYLLFNLTILSTGIFAQGEMSVFNTTGRGGIVTTTARDYQTLGVNPANLAVKNRFDKRFALGFNELGASIYSDALTKTALIDSFLGGGDINSFSLEQKSAAAKQFTDAGLGFNLDYMVIGFGMNLPKFGGLAFNVRTRNSSFTKIDGFASSILFEGFNSDYFNIDTSGGDSVGIAKIPTSASQLIGNTRINLSSTVEANLGYARNVFEKEDEISIYAGVGFKYIVGLAAFNFDAVDGGFGGYLAIPSGVIDLDDTTGEGVNFKFSPAGKGFGIDIGGTVILKNRITLSASLVDVGSIKYTGQNFILKDFTLDTLNYDGVESYNIYQDIGELIGGETLFEIEEASDIKVALPTKIRLGGTINLLEEKLLVGADIIIPVNDAVNNFYNPIIALGGTFRPVKALELSSGAVLGINYDVSVPFGITISTKPYEIGLATRDILILFGQKSPNISFAMGFMRFRF